MVCEFGLIHLFCIPQPSLGYGTWSDSSTTMHDHYIIFNTFYSVEGTHEFHKLQVSAFCDICHTTVTQSDAHSLWTHLLYLCNNAALDMP